MRKVWKPNQGRLKDANGKIVDSELRADTLAAHLQQVQWARPTTVLPEPHPINQTLPVNIGPISHEEFCKAVSIKFVGHIELKVHDG